MDAHVSKPIEAKALFETLQAMVFASEEEADAADQRVA